MGRLFNGTSEQIAIGAFSLTSQQSQVAWFRYKAGAGAGTYGLVSKYDGTAPGPAWFLGVSAHKLISVNVDSGATGHSVAGTTTLSDGTWYCAGASFDGSNIRVWLNGALDCTPVAIGSIRAGTATPMIGSSGNNLFFPGDVAHAAVWSRALTTKEFASLGAGLLPSHLNPDHYWPVWGSDSPEPDLVSASLDGTLTGTVKSLGGPPVGLSLLEIAA